MNKVFSEYTTSTAFLLQLSKAQCHVLLRIERGEKWDNYCFHPHQARPLAHRGLIRRLSEKEKKSDEMRIYALTKAGELVCGLLHEAGLTLTSTQTLSLKRSQDFWGAKAKI